MIIMHSRIEIYQTTSRIFFLCLLYASRVLQGGGWLRGLALLLHTHIDDGVAECTCLFFKKVVDGSKSLCGLVFVDAVGFCWY